MSSFLLRRLTSACLREQGRTRLPRCSLSTKPPVPPSSRSWRPYTTISAIAIISATAYAIGAIYPPTALSILFPRVAPGPPSDPNSPEAIAYTEELEAKLQKLPLLERLRQADDRDEWYEVRPYTNFPEERRVNNLSAGTLRGPGKLALPGLMRVRRDEAGSYMFLHVGRGLCGHDGIVHGGLLATLLDETLARTAISNFPEKVGVTAKLSLNYRAPTIADQFIVLKTKLIEVKGRKAVVSGTVETLDGALLVEAEATFVQPRYAKLLSTQLLKQAMGEAPKSDAPVLLADGEKLKVKSA